MLSSLFGFGKRRRRSTKRSTKKHHSRKPPARLLKICKKYHVKATKKVGKHRVYKSVSVLKRACLKKARAHRKKLLRKVKKHAKRSKKSVHRRRSHRRKSHRMRMGEMDEMSFGRRYGFGAMVARRGLAGLATTAPTTKPMSRDSALARAETSAPGMWGGTNNFGARRSIPMFGRVRRSRYGFGRKGLAGLATTAPPKRVSQDSALARAQTSAPGMWSGVGNFGKRRGRRGAPRRAKVSKAKAMKAFRSFYKRHCAGARRSRYGFGDGGNPMLSASMGTEFCPNGMGGVLGTDSTGLFPSPCRMASTSGSVSGSMAGSMAGEEEETAFGRRRYRRRRNTAVGTRRRRRASAVGAHHRRRRRSAM